MINTIKKQNLKFNRFSQSLTAIAAATLCFSATVNAQDELPDDLSLLSLDELLNIEVTSVSKKAEPLHTAAAAIFVITGDQIRSSGIQSIAEALRMVPGLEVARTDAGEYAISARGFNSGSADKLEVLIDGRSAYTPLFSGVFWDTLDTFMEDIDRIEVIRGPGATLWGANAVNGVINIITKPASETQDAFFTLIGGDELRHKAGFRAGISPSDSHQMRVYLQTEDRDGTVNGAGDDQKNDRSKYQAGVRSDWQLADDKSLFISVNGHDGNEGHAPNNSSESTLFRGADLTAKFTSGIGSDSPWHILGSWDYYDRRIPTLYGEKRTSLNFEAQKSISLGSHALTAGVGYKRSEDETAGPPALVIFSPANRTIEVKSAFIQDQIRFADDRGSLTLGAKFENNDFTGDEVQPSARLGWEYNDNWFSWGAVSRAVRTPNRLNHDLAIFCPPPAGIPGLCGPNVLLPFGNRNFDSESVIAYETGLRYRSGSRFSIDLATFYNDYEDLLTNETFTGFGNEATAKTYGAELSAKWLARTDLSLGAFVSFLDIDVDASGSTDASVEATTEGSSPEQQAGLTVNWKKNSWEVNTFAKYVGKLNSGNVPSYTQVDMVIAKQLHRYWRLALIGNNLLDEQHAEFGTNPITRSEIERSVMLQLSASIK